MCVQKKWILFYLCDYQKDHAIIQLSFWLGSLLLYCRCMFNVLLQLYYFLCMVVKVIIE